MHWIFSLFKLALNNFLRNLDLFCISNFLHWYEVQRAGIFFVASDVPLTPCPVFKLDVSVWRMILAAFPPSPLFFFLLFLEQNNQLCSKFARSPNTFWCTLFWLALLDAYSAKGNLHFCPQAVALSYVNPVILPVEHYVITWSQ